MAETKRYKFLFFMLRPAFEVRFYVHRAPFSLLFFHSFNSKHYIMKNSSQFDLITQIKGNNTTIEMCSK